MRRLIIIFSLFLLSLGSAGVAANFRNAQDLRNAMLDKQTAQWQFIRGMIICQSMMGHTTVTFHEAVKDKKDGKVAFIRHVPPMEMQLRIEAAAGIDPKDKELFVKEYAKGLGNLLTGMQGETGADMGALLGMQGIGEFLGAGAPDEVELAKMYADWEADKQQQIADLEKFFSSAKIVGSEEVSGRPTYHLRSNTAAMKFPQEKGYIFEPKSAEMWIDKEELVQVKLKVVGKLTSDGQTRDMTIEQVESNFKKVDPLFISHQKVSRMAGVLGKKEQEQMEQAQKELAKFKAQLEKMPEQQRAMIKGMMGSKMEQFEKMASSGGIEMVTHIECVGFGGVEEYRYMMAHYAAGIPADQIPPLVNPFSQQP